MKARSAEYYMRRPFSCVQRFTSLCGILTATALMGPAVAQGSGNEPVFEGAWSRRTPPVAWRLSSSAPPVVGCVSLPTES